MVQSKKELKELFVSDESIVNEISGLPKDKAKEAKKLWSSLQDLTNDPFVTDAYKNSNKSAGKDKSKFVIYCDYSKK